MNKKGRKYDREKWGWKSEDEINEHCHYSDFQPHLIDHHHQHTLPNQV